MRRSEEEISRIIEEFRASGLTRVAYSRRSGVPVSTLSNYCRRYKGNALVRVQVEEAAGQARPLALVIGSRRIEIGCDFNAAALVRLIRAVEAA
jgi:hypothetical protein